MVIGIGPRRTRFRLQSFTAPVRDVVQLIANIEANKAGACRSRRYSHARIP